MAFPTLNDSDKRRISCSICVDKSFNCSRLANSTSSSLKSSSSSTRDTKLSNRVLKRVNSRLNPPRIWFIARRWVAADVEAIKSATASACERSIFPFANARCVNSPGRADRHPLRISKAIICCCIYKEP